jgi:hypothetical protein
MNEKELYQICEYVKLDNNNICCQNIQRGEALSTEYCIAHKIKNDAKIESEMLKCDNRSVDDLDQC